MSDLFPYDQIEQENHGLERLGEILVSVTELQAVVFWDAEAKRYKVRPDVLEGLGL